MYSAKVILDSINPYNGIRLTTSELTYPRFIHAEMMTHRLFSRNSASSRAIPNSKMIKMVDEYPAMPVYWGKSRKGMSANKEVDNIGRCERLWIHCKDQMVDAAESFKELKLHKQIANRILEPWKYITVIISTTQISNFMALRNHEDAQPEIALIAKMWNDEFNNSEPKEREWHIPYIQEDEESLDLELKCKIGTARCARVSYLTHNGKRSIEKDLELHDRLLVGSGFGHWSAFEHVAKATDMRDKYFNFATEEWEDQPIRCGNFQGWIQYRKMQRNECQ